MENDELELGHYGRIFRRNWWMFALAVPACILLALVLLPSPRDFYESRILVSLRAGDLDAGRPNDPINEENEVGLAQSPPVVQAVIDASPYELTKSDLEENLGVGACLDGDALASSNDCDSQIIHFIYRADTPDEAASTVQLMAETYLSRRVERERNLRQEEIDNLELQLADLSLLIQNESQILSEAEPESVVATLSELRLRRLDDEAFDINNRLSTIEATPVDVGELLGDASDPVADTSGVPRPFSVLAGTIVGFLVAAVAATLSDRLDRRVAAPSEVEADLGVPVLGDIPRITQDSPPLVTAVSANTPGAEAFRRLAAAALVPRDGYIVDSITITGAHDKEGRTTSAVNMALALAQSGRPVLLVAADRRNNDIDRLFGLTGTPGLNDFLRSRADLDAARSVVAKAEERLGIRVVSGGTGNAPPLSTGAMAALLAAANERNLMVVFDAPPALTNADGLQLAAIADAVYILAGLGRTRRSELNQLRIQLLNVQADLAGAIINRNSRLTLLPTGVASIGPGSVRVPSGVPGSVPEGAGEPSMASIHDMGRPAAAPPPQASPPESVEDVTDEVV